MPRLTYPRPPTLIILPTLPAPHSSLQSPPNPAISSVANANRLQDGPGRYRLVGIVSHMGNSTACGHYVAHAFKDGHWVIFNDEKVAASAHPPRSLGYMYVYAREDTKAAQLAATATAGTRA